MKSFILDLVGVVVKVVGVMAGTFSLLAFCGATFPATCCVAMLAGGATFVLDTLSDD